jgi:hypothetical protein
MKIAKLGLAATWREAARKGVIALCALSLLTLPFGPAAYAQNPPPAPVASQPAQPQLLTPAQLENLVSPIALYPDPLLGQVLAASTYPLEVVEAEQWIQQNPNLRSTDLMNAAKQQNWDPSVQALVAFPDALSLLNRDISWTTDLGNAYLAQQQDVMSAIQRMRVRAEQNGKLTSTAQQTVTTQTQDGQSAVVIEPANPQVIYVPVYNPAYVWGPPVWGYYPPLWYPAVSFGFGFGPGIYLSGFFPAWGGWGWRGWGPSWGWGLGWFGGGIFVNNFFFNHYGFHGFRGGGFAGVGREHWAHDPYHRGGVAYANRSVAARYNNSRFAAGRSINAGRTFNGNASRSFNANGGRSFNGSAGRTFNANGGRSFNANGGARSLNNGTAHGFAPANRGNANLAPNAGQRLRTPGGPGASTPRAAPGIAGRNNGGQGQRFSAPRSSGNGFGGGSRSFSAPRSAPAQHFSAPRSFGGGGGRSFGGGGRSFGGGGGHVGGGGFGGGHAGGGGHGGGRR